MTTQARPLDAPPGGVLMWLIVGLELVTFAIALVMIAALRASEPALFAVGQASLSPAVGLALTLLLVSSGALAAEAVHAARGGRFERAQAFFGAAIALGLGFVGLKVFDTRAHLDAGHGLGSSDFWDAYLLGTGFHFVHVLVGLLLLAGVAVGLKKSRDPELVAAVALFWHLCDLAWFFLFPLFFARS